MGLSTVTQFIRRTLDALFISEVQVTPSADTLPVTAEHYAPPGIDAVPLAGDTACQVPGAGRSGAAVVGYMDTANEGAAAGGEVRIYARGSDGSEDGIAVVCTVWVKADGSVLLSNGNGSVTLEADGKVVADVTTAEFAGNTDEAALASRVQALETWANGHTHGYTNVSTPSTTTTPTVASNSGPFGSAVLKVGS